MRQQRPDGAQCGVHAHESREGVAHTGNQPSAAEHKPGKLARIVLGGLHTRALRTLVWDTVARLVTDLLTAAAGGDWHAEVGRLFYLPDAPVQHSPTMSAVLHSVSAWLRQALASGRACGAIRDDLPVSLQMAFVNDVLRCLDNWSLQHLHEYPKPAQRDITRTQIDALRRLLAP